MNKLITSAQQSPADHQVSVKTHSISNCGHKWMSFWSDRVVLEMVYKYVGFLADSNVVSIRSKKTRKGPLTCFDKLN